MDGDDLWSDVFGLWPVLRRMMVGADVAYGWTELNYGRADMDYGSMYLNYGCPESVYGRMYVGYEWTELTYGRLSVPVGRFGACDPYFKDSLAAWGEGRGWVKGR